MSKQTNIFTVFDGTVSTPTTISLHGLGSVYTYRAYGTAGQTVEVRGGFVGDTWADMQQIAVLTVGGTQSAVVQHTWPLLAIDGTAQVKIARGNA